MQEFRPSENSPSLSGEPAQRRDGMSQRIWKEGSVLPGLSGGLPPRGAEHAGGLGRGGVRWDGAGEISLESG